MSIARYSATIRPVVVNQNFQRVITLEFNDISTDPITITLSLEGATTLTTSMLQVAGSIPSSLVIPTTLSSGNGPGRTAISSDIKITDATIIGKKLIFRINSASRSYMNGRILFSFIQEGVDETSIANNITAIRNSQLTEITKTSSISAKITNVENIVKSEADFE